MIWIGSFHFIWPGWLRMMQWRGSLGLNNIFVSVRWTQLLVGKAHCVMCRRELTVVAGTTQLRCLSMYFRYLYHLHLTTSRETINGTWQKEDSSFMTNGILTGHIFSFCLVDCVCIVVLCRLFFYWRPQQQKQRTHRSLEAYCATLW
jgi:hypothetical protein